MEINVLGSERHTTVTGLNRFFWSLS